MPKMEMVKGASDGYCWKNRSKGLIIFNPDIGLNGGNGVEQRNVSINSMYLVFNIRVRSELEDDFLEIQQTGKLLRVDELLAIEVYDLLHDILCI